VILTDNSGGLGYPIVPESTEPLLFTNAPTADTNGIYWGNTNIGVKLLYPDGSKDIFALAADPVATYFAIPQWIVTVSNPVVRLLLTQRIDPEGRVTQLGYESLNSALLGPYRVKYVVDPDLRTNTFHYTANNNNKISEIDDPYGRKTTLGYNSDGTLHQIVDAASLTTSFQYPPSQVTATVYYVSQTNDVAEDVVYTTEPSSGWISQMTTPYGTNQFLYYEVDDSTVTDGVQQRAVYASEPQGAGQLYYYLHKNSNLPNTDTAPVVPGITNFDDGNAGGISGHNALYYRNTFHWGRRQFDALAGNSGFMNNLSSALALQSIQPTLSASCFSNAFAVLTINDLYKAEMKHWLWQSDNTSISGSVSSERAPSFDTAGQNPGLRTWYNYTGKPAGGAEDLGSNPQIACVAKVLPGTNSQYTVCNFYPQGMRGSGLVSDRETSYSLPGGSLGELTNWFTYAANSVDLISVSNSAGQYINYGYNGGHQIIAMTNALNQVAIQSWDPSTRNLAGIQLPSGESINFGYFSPATPPTATSSLLQWETLQPEGRCFTNNSFYAGLPTSVTDDRGVTLQNTWDGLNRLTSTVFPDTTTISNVYNRLDLAATKDRMGNWTYAAYDGLQHLTNVVKANGAATAYEWCGCGSLGEIIDAQNGTHILNYDNQGNLVNEIFPDTSSVTRQFDLAGRMTSEFDGVGRWRSFGYNNQGLAVSVTDANGTVQSTVFDALNRPVAVTDANGVTVSNVFDAINELVQRLLYAGWRRPADCRDQRQSRGHAVRL
jgi:YD repeat-containing protein